MGEPAGGVLALQLAVERRRRHKRVVPALQLVDQGGVGRALAGAPAQERADPSQAPAPGVVGPRLSDPVVDGRVREQTRMRRTRVIEQGGELSSVLVRRLRVGVAPHEPFDEARGI
jgi:hypothetical protein